MDEAEDAMETMAGGVRMLEIEGLSHSFSGLRAVDGAEFFVDRGEVVGLIGPNGAGKTTVFNLISGAIKAKEGTVRFKGEDITDLRPDQVCLRGLARTFQTTKLFDGMTAFENVRLALIYGNPHHRFRYREAEREVNQLMASMGLLSDRNRLVRDLSLASRRRLEIARALATNAEMLLLDEAMAGLTPSELEQAMQLVRRLHERGLTILMIEHVMQAIMGVCDRIIVFHEGRKIAEGPPDVVATHPTVKSIYLGHE
jgi:branched-chain amino acid transport system ATP-binding protein